MLPARLDAFLCRAHLFKTWSRKQHNSHWLGSDRVVAGIMQSPLLALKRTTRLHPRLPTIGVTA